MTRDIAQLFLATEDVGSLPLLDDFESTKENVKRAISDKISVGLDFPCYPQLMGTETDPMNMNLQFLIPLAKARCGVKIEGRRALLVNKIKRPDHAIGIERAKFYINFLKERELLESIKGPKACVTGPFTLAGYLDNNSIFTSGASKREVISILSEIIGDCCEELSSLGFKIINVDEPYFELMIGKKILFNYDSEFIIQILNNIIEKINCFSAIHVCGIINPMIKEILLESKVDILDHEFFDSPRNISMYQKEDVEKKDKLLAFGCVSSKNLEVESVNQIKRFLQKALNRFGERILIKPDNGFGGLSGKPIAYESAIQKMKNMVDAALSLKRKL